MQWLAGTTEDNLSVVDARELYPTFSMDDRQVSVSLLATTPASTYFGSFILFISCSMTEQQETSADSMKTALKREITSGRILDATYRTIAARGWGAVTLREIAEESGVALSQLSYYFGNKDGLFAAVLERMQQEYAEKLAEKLQNVTSFRERLERLIDYNRLLLKENTDLYRNFLEFFNFAMASPRFKKQVAGFLTGIARAIEEQITQKQKSNQQLASYSSSAVTHFILSASFGISLQHLLAPKNKDVEAGFDVIKTALGIVFSADSKDPSRNC